MVFYNFAPEINNKIMKTIISKTAFLAIILSLISSSITLADGPVQKGSNVLGFGIGMANRYYFSGFSPGVKVNFESGLWQAGPGVVTLGGTFGYTFQSYSNRYWWGSTYNYSWHNFIIAARSAWHHNWGVDKLDTYAGASAGVRFNIANNGGDPADPYSNSVHPHFGGFVGAAYYFKPALGVFAEVGYDINFITIGLNLNFGNH